MRESIVGYLPTIGKVMIILSLAAVYAQFCGCSGGKTYDDLGDFSLALFRELKAGNVDRVATQMCVNMADCKEQMRLVESRNPRLKFDVNPNVINEDIKNSHREAIEVFVNSYRDLLEAEPASFSARHHEALNTDKLIIWVKKGEKYYGLVIESVIKTRSGYKVNDWLGPLADPSRDPSTLRKKKAVLQSDTKEGCVFPRSGIVYEYTFVN